MQRTSRVVTHGAERFVVPILVSSVPHLSLRLLQLLASHIHAVSGGLPVVDAIERPRRGTQQLEGLGGGLRGAISREPVRCSGDGIAGETGHSDHVGGVVADGVYEFRVETRVMYEERPGAAVARCASNRSNARSRSVQPCVLAHRYPATMPSNPSDGPEIIAPSGLAYGQALAHLDLLEKAVNEVGAKQGATEQLVQGTLAQVPTLLAELQEVRADNQALRARVDELERLNKSVGVGGGAQPATLAALRGRRAALAEIKEAGLSAGEARAAGYTCADVKAVGYDLAAARAAGWPMEELRTVGYVGHKGMSARDFVDKYQAGCRNFAGLDFAGEDFSGLVIGQRTKDAKGDYRIDGCDFSRCSMSTVSFDHVHLVGVNFTGADLSNADFSDLVFDSCNFTDAKLPGKEKWQGAKWQGGGLVVNGSFQQTKFSCSEAKAMGFTPNHCKAAGFTEEDCKKEGYMGTDGYLGRRFDQLSVLPSSLEHPRHACVAWNG